MLKPESDRAVGELQVRSRLSRAADAVCNFQLHTVGQTEWIAASVFCRRRRRRSSSHQRQRSALLQRCYSTFLGRRRGLFELLRPPPCVLQPVCPPLHLTLDLGKAFSSALLLAGDFPPLFIFRAAPHPTLSVAVSSSESPAPRRPQICISPGLCSD